MTGFGKVVLGASAGFLAAGILFPEMAEILLRLYLLSLAGGFVATRAYEAALPRRTSVDAYSPFTGEGASRPPLEAPAAIRRRALLLRAADDPVEARRARVPVSVKWAVLDEVSHRLAERHGLDLGDPAHHPQVRSLVSGATWRLVRPLDAGEEAWSSGGGTGDGRPVVIDELHSILDDLERL